MSSSEFYDLLYGNTSVPKITPVPTMPNISESAEKNPLCEFHLAKVIFCLL